MEKNNFLLRTTDKHKAYNNCYDIDGDGEYWIKGKCSECGLGKLADIHYDVACKVKELREYELYHEVVCTAKELCEYG